MKKQMAGLCLLLIFVLPVLCCAETNAYTTSLACNVTECTEGDTVAVRILLQAVGAETPTCAECELECDSDKLRAVSVGNAAGFRHRGSRLIIVDTGSEIATNGTAFTIQFSAEKAGIVTVTLKSAAYGSVESAATSDVAQSIIGDNTVTIVIKAKKHTEDGEHKEDGEEDFGKQDDNGKGTVVTPAPETNDKSPCALLLAMLAGATYLMCCDLIKYKGGNTNDIETLPAAAYGSGAAVRTDLYLCGKHGRSIQL